MKIIRTKAALRTLTDEWSRAGQTIGVVPTMGALHAGHLSLVGEAKAKTDRVIVTLFVNPRQFNNPEDLANYPRTEDSDSVKLAPFAVDVLYVPDPDQIYPDGFSTSVSVSGVSEGLCGAARPGHFDGVATVVSKLLLQTAADEAYFGEKDYQQLQVVTRLAQDLDLKTRITGCPTVREPDGLAMSSRNLRLGEEARKIAPVVYHVLTDIAEGLARGASLSELLPDARQTLDKAGFGTLDYLELRSAQDLEPMDSAVRPARLFIAVWLDGVRLIDNIPIPSA
ncbi:pantoate--beta-alanine ligase [Neptunicoccus cionae]|uniref:pantoate--beta-alanine ligase n=1 Tax=Neptunicoccus cionae TaxID=2035344 RepID=UPI000C764198|nr:pantoate--beta-alanine ligase [Amylibacter cionae]PLS21462.1 pantoate--beta-alanine ligase [Amylibacter cionae]